VTGVILLLLALRLLARRMKKGLPTLVEKGGPTTRPAARGRERAPPLGVALFMLVTSMHRVAPAALVFQAQDVKERANAPALYALN